MTLFLGHLTTLFELQRLYSTKEMENDHLD